MSLLIRAGLGLRLGLRAGLGLAPRRLSSLPPRSLVDLQDLQSVLSAPVAAPSPLLPNPDKPGRVSRLPSVAGYAPSVSVSVSLSAEEHPNRPSNDTDPLLSSTSRSLTVADFNSAILSNSLHSRPEKALAVFQLIGQAGLIPSSASWNLLLDAFANAGDLDGALNVFTDMSLSASASTLSSLRTMSTTLSTTLSPSPSSSTLPGIHASPDLYTYSIMIKACVGCGELEPAFKFYQEMKLAGIIPTQPIFTTLIKGCIKAGDFARAWKTFDYMRGEICKPDEVSFTTMISLCAKAKEVERAFDLYEEMRELALVPTNVTFNTLIQACGSRDDYYVQVFELLENMIRQGFTPDTVTYNVLLGAASKNGDVKRARLIWNHLIHRWSLGEAAAPSASSCMFLFGSYAHAIAKRNKGMAVDGLASASKAQKSVEADPGLDSETKSLTTFEDVADDSGVLTLVGSDCDHPLYLSGPLNVNTLVKDAQQVWDYTQLPASPIQTTPHLFNSYLSIYSYGQLAKDGLALFEKHRAILDITGETFKHVLRLTTKDKSKMVVAEALWSDLVAWDQQEENKLVNLTMQEREKARLAQKRGRDDWWKFYRSMILAKTRTGELDSAIDFIKESQEFRHPTYLPSFYFKDVYPLVVKCLDLHADGSRETFKSLVAVLPVPPPKTSLDEAQALLRKRFTNKNWWGWEALGVNPEKTFREGQRTWKERKTKVQMHREMRSEKRFSVKDIIKLKPRQ